MTEDAVALKRHEAKRASLEKVGAAWRAKKLVSQAAETPGTEWESAPHFDLALPAEITDGKGEVIFKGRVVRTRERSGKSGTQALNWKVREGTGSQLAPWLEEKPNRALAIVDEGQDPSVHTKFEVLKNLLSLIDVVVEGKSDLKVKNLIEALTPDIPLSSNRIAEAKMFADAMRVILESGDFVKSQDIARVAHFSRKNPSSQPNRWKRSGQIFAVSYKGSDLYPAYALNWKEGAKPLPVMKKILKLFPDKDGWQKAFWFGSVNSYLRNKMPKNVLQSHPEEVLKAAELEVIGLQQG